MRARIATTADAPALARIYNQGLEERTATFETTLRSEHDVLGWFDGVHPIVVVVDDGAAGEVAAFARTTEYSPRDCYRGIFEFSVYTERAQRRRGAALLAMRELVTRAREAGAWKLVARVFVENEPSRALLAAVGFREVGTYHRHAKLDDRWRDVVIVEKFLAPLEAISSLASRAGAAPRAGSRADVLATLRVDGRGDPAALAQSLDWTRALIESFRVADAEVLDAVADAFFATKVHPAALRTQFVDLFRAYAALSSEASRDVYALLFSRLARIPIASDLEAFYEALFVVKQTARGVDQALSPHVDELVTWMREIVELPSGLRQRISPGNVASLLMTLATSAGASNEQRHAIAELAVLAKLRHRVDAPTSLQRASLPPPAPDPIIEAAPRRSLPPPLPQRRPSVPAPSEIVDADVPIPLSSQDLLPYSSLDDLPTPVVEWKPAPLSTTREPDPDSEPDPDTGPEKPASKRARQPKKASTAAKPKKRSTKRKKAQ
jgi:phosphinothricin acetyltransferase